MRQGCIVCHSPHGSVNQRLLNERNQTLCLKCHFQQQTSRDIFSSETSITPTSCRRGPAGRPAAMRNRTAPDVTPLLSTDVDVMRSSRRFLRAGLRGFSAAEVRAGDTSDGKATTRTTEEQPEEYNNWIELGIGGVITRATCAVRTRTQAARRPALRRNPGPHYEHTFGKDATLTVDGHAIWDTNDYDIQVQFRSQSRLH